MVERLNCEGNDIVLHAVLVSCPVRHPQWGEFPPAVGFLFRLYLATSPWHLLCLPFMDFLPRVIIVPVSFCTLTSLTLNQWASTVHRREQRLVNVRLFVTEEKRLSLYFSVLSNTLRCCSTSYVQDRLKYPITGFYIPWVLPWHHLDGRAQQEHSKMRLAAFLHAVVVRRDVLCFWIYIALLSPLYRHRGLAWYVSSVQAQRACSARQLMVTLHHVVEP